jgi:hypothetical protein
VEVGDDKSDDEDTWKEKWVDEVEDQENLRKSVYNHPPIAHNSIIPSVGSKLCKDLLTCNRCWARDLVCIRPPVGQACNACRIMR